MLKRPSRETPSLKRIEKERRPKNNFKEVDIPLNNEHPCVTKVLKVFDELVFFAIVMEYALGVNFSMML